MAYTIKVLNIPTNLTQNTINNCCYGLMDAFSSLLTGQVCEVQPQLDHSFPRQADGSFVKGSHLILFRLIRDRQASYHRRNHLLTARV